MAAEKKSFGGEIGRGAWIGAGLFAGIELIAYLINPIFAGGLLFYGALGGAIGGTIHLLKKLASSATSEPAK